MILIIGTFRIRPERLPEALPVMERMITASRAEPGCVGYSYARDLLDSGLIRVTEAWDDQPSLDAHFASSHIADWRAEWPRLEITDRDLRAFTVEADQPT